MGRVFWVIEGALAGVLVVALPCAMIWGSHGPDWPFIPLAFTTMFGAALGWRLSG